MLIVSSHTVSAEAWESLPLAVGTSPADEWRCLLYIPPGEKPLLHQTGRESAPPEQQAHRWFWCNWISRWAQKFHHRILGPAACHLHCISSYTPGCYRLHLSWFCFINESESKFNQWGVFFSFIIKTLPLKCGPNFESAAFSIWFSLKRDLR